MLALGSASVSLAHGDWPAKHGGLMNEGGETSFELVARKGKAVLYVEDHGTPVPTAGAKGTLEVARGAETLNVELRAADGNRLQAVSPVSLKPGDRVKARVVMANGSIAVGRFFIGSR